MSFFFKNLFSSVVGQDQDAFFQDIYSSAFVCDVCDKSQYDQIQRAKGSYKDEKIWLLDQLSYYAAVECEDECKGGSYFDCEEPSYIQSLYTGKCNAQMHLDLSTHLTVLRQTYYNVVGDFLYEDYFDEFHNQIFESNYGINETGKEYLPESIRRRLLKKAIPNLKSRIQDSSIRAKDAPCKGRGRYSYYCPRHNWCVTKQDLCDVPDRETLKLKTNDKPFFREPLDEQSTEYFHAVHEFYLKQFCNACLVNMNENEKAKYLFRDVSVQSRELFSMIQSLRGMSDMQSLLDTAQGFLLLLERGYTQGFDNNNNMEENEEKFLELSEQLTNIVFRKIEQFIESVSSLDDLNRFIEEYDSRFGNLINKYIWNPLKRSIGSKLRWGNLERRHEVWTNIRERDESLNDLAQIKKRKLEEEEKKTKQGKAPSPAPSQKTRQSERLRKQRASRERKSQERRRREHESRERKSQERHRRERESRERKEREREEQERLKQETVKKFQTSCLAKDVELQRLKCTRDEEKKMFRALHPDKNLGCPDEAKNKMQKYMAICRKTERSWVPDDTWKK